MDTLLRMQTAYDIAAARDSEGDISRLSDTLLRPPTATPTLPDGGARRRALFDWLVAG
jgi:hypothetical protein